MKIQADTINGCYEVADFEDTAEVVDQYNFYDSLNTLTDKVIGSEIDNDMFDTIHNEYGIHTIN